MPNTIIHIPKLVTERHGTRVDPAADLTQDEASILAAYRFNCEQRDRIGIPRIVPVSLRVENERSA